MVDPTEPPYGGGFTDPKYALDPAGDWLINPGSGLQFDGHILVAGGALNATEIPIAEVAGQVAPVIPVTSGSEVTAGAVLVAGGVDGGVSPETLGGPASGGISIVGGSGLSPTLAESIARRSAGNPAPRTGARLPGSR